jgi:Protein of unknown function (DUF3300)
MDGGKKMIGTFMKRLVSTALSFLLVVNAVHSEAQDQQQAAPAGDTEYSGQGTPLSADDLQKLVAPIALYPDALVAQILGAATFPDQVETASNFMQVNKSLTGSALAQAVDKEQWDPSVKALTEFPSVLDNLAQNLSWTSSLGEAYHTQAADVMSAVQVLRAKAKAAGNLKSSEQITVVQQSPQVIVIQPTNPQVVYVPQYNPAVVYGTPYVAPGYSTAAVVTTAVLSFGVGIAIGAAMNNNCCGWGYSSWNCNWHGGAVYYGGGAYYGNNAWHGGYYGSAHVNSGYNSSTGTYGRSATVSTPYGSRSAGQAYNPSTGTYARGASASGPNGSAAAGQAYNPYTGASARGAAASGPNGSAAAGQAYNPNTGAYAATHQSSNAYGNYGSSVASKNGNTAVTQHQTTSQGSVGTVQTSNGGRGAAATGANGNSAVAGQTANGNRYAAGESANGNKYATQNGNVYKDSGSGWQQTQPQRSTSGTDSAAARGYGGQEKTSGSSAFGGGGGSGWQSREASARGAQSRGGGGSRRR